MHLLFLSNIPFINTSVVKYGPWRISLAVSGLSTMPNLVDMTGFSAIIRYDSATKQPVSGMVGFWLSAMNRQQH